MRGLGKMMKNNGQISLEDKAEGIEFITKSFIVGNRARALILRQKSHNYV